MAVCDKNKSNMAFDVLIHKEYVTRYNVSHALIGVYLVCASV